MTAKKPITYANMRLPNEALPRVVDWRTSGKYQGEELKDYDGRPGAMVAAALPSVINGVRVYPKTAK